MEPGARWRMMEEFFAAYTANINKAPGDTPMIDVEATAGRSPTALLQQTRTAFSAGRTTSVPHSDPGRFRVLSEHRNKIHGSRVA